MLHEMSASELERLAKQTAEVTGGKVELVGSWIWVKFASKPSYNDRQWLLDNGYHWNHKRQVW